MAHDFAAELSPLRSGDVKFCMGSLLIVAATALYEPPACAQVTYSTLMEGYARQGNVRMCHELIRQMTLKSVGPNAIVYNILLRVSLQKPRPNIEVYIPALLMWCMLTACQALLCMM